MRIEPPVSVPTDANPIPVATATASALRDTLVGSGIQNGAALTVINSTIAYNSFAGIVLFNSGTEATTLDNTIVTLNTDSAVSGAPADNILNQTSPACLVRHIQPRKGDPRGCEKFGRFSDVADPDLGSFLREELGGCAANASRPSGHDGGLSVQSAHN